MSSVSTGGGPIKTLVDACNGRPILYGLFAALVAAGATGDQWCPKGKKMHWYDTDSGQVCECVDKHPKKNKKKQ